MTDATFGSLAAAQALSRVPGLAGATIDAQLSDGPTNSSFRVAHGNRQYVLRLDKPGAAKLGLNRSNEFEVSRIVVAAGLSPKPVYFNPQEGIYVRPWLEGRSWTLTDLESPVKLTRLAALLRILHTLPPAGQPFDPLAASRRYVAHLDSEDSRAILGKLVALERRIKKRSAPEVLCHNDLVCHNVLEGKGLVLIDWEYAGTGDPYFDLAVVVQHHGLERRLRRLFLEAYLKRPATSGEKNQLDLQSEFYGYMLELWDQRVAGL